MCDCITDLNAELAPKGYKLVRSFIVRPALHDVVTVCVERIDGKAPPPKLPRPRFCPFCGEAYVSAAMSDAAAGFAPGPSERPVA